MKFSLSLPQAKQTTRLLLTVVAALIVLSVLGQVAKYVFGHPQLKGVVPIFYVDYESNVPTWYSSMALALAGGLLCLIAIVKYRQRDCFRHHWAVLSLLFFGLFAFGTSLLNICDQLFTLVQKQCFAHFSNELFDLFCGQNL